jgi:hypothetical protein
MDDKQNYLMWNFSYFNVRRLVNSSWMMWLGHVTWTGENKYSVVQK